MGLDSISMEKLDQKGCVIDLHQRNTEVAIPFLVSSRHYGFLWNTPAVGRVELGVSATCWVAEGAQQLDYFVVYGDTYADILNRYADVTGYAPPLPEWASGFWQCKLRYETQDELMNVAREYKSGGTAALGDRVGFLQAVADGDLGLRPRFFGPIRLAWCANSKRWG